MKRTTGKNRRAAKEEFSWFSIRVDEYRIYCEAGINPFMSPGRRSEPDPLALVYRFQASLEITGIFIGEERNGERVDIKIYGGEFEEGEFDLQVKEFHAIDENFHPIFRKKGERQVPVYKLPSGIGMLDRIRGERNWQGWVRVHSDLAETMLLTLASHPSVYLAIGEHRVGRARWIHRLCLQTTNPETDEQQ